jgi:hypothetical protein
MAFNYWIAIAAFTAGLGLGLFQGQPLWPSAIASGVAPAVLFIAIDFIINKLTEGK